MASSDRSIMDFEKRETTESEGDVGGDAKRPGLAWTSLSSIFTASQARFRSSNGLVSGSAGVPLKDMVRGPKGSVSFKSSSM